MQLQPEHILDLPGQGCLRRARRGGIRIKLEDADLVGGSTEHSHLAEADVPLDTAARVRPPFVLEPDPDIPREDRPAEVGVEGVGAAGDPPGKDRVMLFVEEPDRGVGETSADAGSGDGTDAMKGEGTPKIDLPVAVDRPFRGFGLGGGLVVVGPGGRGKSIGEAQHCAAFEGRQVVRDHEPVQRRTGYWGWRAERDVWYPGHAHFGQ